MLYKGKIDPSTGNGGKKPNELMVQFIRDNIESFERDPVPGFEKINEKEEKFLFVLTERAIARVHIWELPGMVVRYQCLVNNEKSYSVIILNFIDGEFYRLFPEEFY